MSEIRLIASDLDGTLLQNGATAVSGEMFGLIRECRTRGIVFAAASGRQYHSLRGLFAPIADEIAYICENGALTMYGEEVLEMARIEPETAQEIIAVIDADPEAEPLISDRDYTYIKPKNPAFEEVIRRLGNSYRVVRSFEEITGPIIKIALYQASYLGREEEGQRYWQERMPAPAKVVTSGNAWLDVLFPEIHKGVGIRALQRKLGITEQETAVFGDNLNDLEMFAAAGRRVAVENAKVPVLEAATAVTPTVEEYLRDQILC
ncbi:MAG: HAD family hydrolase [Eubacteriales bacterium]|nr:HAD family hydrolase [Eubacteriales bacterium]